VLCNRPAKDESSIIGTSYHLATYEAAGNMFNSKFRDQQLAFLMSSE
jgi:hypothetical protein